MQSNSTRPPAWIPLVSLGLLLLLGMGAFFFKGTDKPLRDSGDLTWLSEESQALALSKKLGKPLLVDFFAQWCEPCHEMDAQVFKHPDVIKKLSEFVLLRLDVTEDNATTDQWTQAYQVFSLPTVAFRDRHGALLTDPRLESVPTVEEFLDALHLASKTQ